MFLRLSIPIEFPSYLVPSTPFRQHSTDAKPGAISSFHNDASSSASPPYLAGCTSHLRCAKCAVDICLTSQIISKGFTGRHGRAYLVSPFPGPTSHVTFSPALPNTKTDSPSQRQLVTGTHTVSDVRCSFCSSMLGWKYDGAEEESQRYKVGKYILETKMVCSSNVWEQNDAAIVDAGISGETIETMWVQDANEIEFDSEDDEECEDLFAGVWNPTLAMKRRKAKNFRKKTVEHDLRLGTSAV